jgi:hypothetical protein
MVASVREHRNARNLARWFGNVREKSGREVFFALACVSLSRRFEKTYERHI